MIAVTILAGGTELEISFLTRELRDICEKQKVADAELGRLGAIDLQRRLAEMEAVDTVEQFSKLVSGDLASRSPTQLALTLPSGHFVVFCAGHVKNPTRPDGSIDWSKISRIRILAIEAEK